MTSSVQFSQDTPVQTVYLPGSDVSTVSRVKEVLEDGELNPQVDSTVNLENLDSHIEGNLREKDFVERMEENNQQQRNKSSSSSSKHGTANIR